MISGVGITNSVAQNAQRWASAASPFTFHPSSGGPSSPTGIVDRPKAVLYPTARQLLHLPIPIVTPLISSWKLEAVA
jgi:hypothetical protein